MDATTLLTVATSITGLLGVFLLVIWVQERSIRSLAWWGAAYLMGGSAVALWGVLDDVSWIPREAPTALLFIACGLIWNGARLFHGRRALPGALFAGAVAWLAATQISGFAQTIHVRIILSSLIIATYTFLTALELRRERRRSLMHSWRLIGVPLLHGVLFLAPIPLVLMLPPDSSLDAWFALFALETLLYVVGTAFIVVVMAKEQVVLVHKTAATIDMLTGLFNRRAFHDAAHALIARHARKRLPVSVLMFDLDRFKSINDTYGHAIGDEALKVFAKTAASSMRATDVIGRLGGEEFVAILPGTTSDAHVVAERVRAAFEAAGVEIAGYRMGATVSTGIASSPAPVELEALLARADVALYRAKQNGRNRVEAAPESGTQQRGAEEAMPVRGQAAMAQ